MAHTLPNQVSICSTCYRRVDAKIVFQDGGVWMLKRCHEHGSERVLLADNIDYYRRAREIFLKTPEQVARYNTPVRWGCQYDCGICPVHEQHGCISLIEVTDACNLRCPTCYTNSGPERQNHRPLEQIEAMLDLAVEVLRKKGVLLAEDMPPRGGQELKQKMDVAYQEATSEEAVRNYLGEIRDS